MSHITTHYTRLRALALSGRDVSHDLKGGARLAVRVRGDQVTLTIARKGVEVGQVEERTFRRDCFVPTSAERIPKEGQSTRSEGSATWYLVGYRWEDNWQEAR